MQIGTLSKRSGVSVRMLRYYEEEGLLRPARRPSGYREYGSPEEEAVRRIRLLGEAGLKLDTIRRFLPCVLSDRPAFDPCPDLLAALRTALMDVERRITGLQASRQILSSYLEGLDDHA